MSQSLPDAYVFQRRFTDIEDLAVEARQWRIDVRQLERGRLLGDVLQFGVKGVHVSEARFCRSLNQKGTPPLGMRTIGVPAHPNLRLTWRGQSIDGECVLVFPRGSELSSVSGPDFHIYTCSFPEEMLSAVGDALTVGDIDAVCSGREAIRIGPSAMESMRGRLRQICSTVRSTPADLTSPKIVSRLSLDLPSSLLTAMAQGQGKCPPAAGPKRLAAVARAEAFIEQNARDEIRVGDICHAAGVSERTLEYAFVEQFGIGPKEFLTAFRLFSIYRQLRAADERTTRVADIANAWGFWHMGQFAADYRSRFDELPSETLRRRASQSVAG